MILQANSQVGKGSGVGHIPRSRAPARLLFGAVLSASAFFLGWFHPCTYNSADVHRYNYCGQGEIPADEGNAKEKVK